MAVVTQTDRPKLVRNRCAIGDFVLSRCFLDFFVDAGAFVIGLRHIFLFQASVILIVDLQQIDLLHYFCERDSFAGSLS